MEKYIPQKDTNNTGLEIGKSEMPRNTEMEEYISGIKNRAEVSSFLRDFTNIDSQEKALEVIEVWNSNKAFKGQSGEVFSQENENANITLKAYHFLESDNVKFGYKIK
ncbi:MAG: hypothetical protein ACI9AR_000272 [Flavobacteriaceae bacterium]|jgi:hypothetical protein